VTVPRQQVPLANAVDVLIDYRGKTPPKSTCGVWLVTAKVIKDGSLDGGEREYITEETYSRWMTRGFPEPGDVLLTTEAPLGEVAMVPAGAPIALAQRVILLRAKRGTVDPQYLFAALRSPLMQARLRERATGTTVLGIKQAELRRVLLPLPSLVSQRKIGSILSAYDDLIANIRKRIIALGETAQRIYREWFVDFRYPGHEAVLLVDSELGPIPEGWRTGVLGDLVQETRDAITAGPSTEGRPYVPIDAISPRCLTLRDWRSGQEAASSLLTFQRSDFLFGAMRPYFHKVAIAPWEGTTRSTCFVLRTRSDDTWAIAALSLFDDRTIDFATAHSSGTTIPYARWRGGLANMPIVMPPSALAEQFQTVSEPMLRALQDSGSMLANLRAARDLLLPRLVSGEIDVEDLDIRAGEAVA